MIDLVPIGGLCNRMRMIDAGLELGRRLQMPVRAHWMPSKDLGCPFHELFQPIDGLEIVEGMWLASRLAFRFGRRPGLMHLSGWLWSTRYYYWNENKRLAHEVALLTPLQQRRHVHIISDARFVEPAEPYRVFRPLPMLQASVDRVVQQFGPRTVGVHIRRADNVLAIERSPDHLFISAMDNELEANGDTRFFLATDSMEVKRDLRARYGDRVITNHALLDRTSREGMQHALVELYALSNTHHILGSYFSSFSQAASEIGRIGLTVLCEEEGKPRD